MEDLISLVIALASELAQQGRAGKADPALIERTKSATRRLRGSMGYVPPPLRRRVQRIISDSAAIIGNAERRLAAAHPPSKPTQQAPPPPAVTQGTAQPPVSESQPGPAGIASEVARAAPAIDPADVRKGIIWATILGQPRSLDPGW